jgi:hypothetical protein
VTRAWRRPVVFFHNGQGDKLLARPALRALCAIFPGRLRMVCHEGDADRFYSEIAFAGVGEVAFRRQSGEWRFDADAGVEAVGDADGLVFLNTWFSQDVADLLARFPRAESVGFFREFTHRLPGAGRRHAVETAFQLPLWLDPSLRLEDFSYPPRFDARTVEAALRIRETLGPPRRVLAVHMTTAAEKMWPLDRWRELLRRFLAAHADYVALVLAPGPFGFEGTALARVIPVYGLPLATAYALVGTADLFAGVDSCMLHAADLYRVPSVGLFGPTSAREWGVRFGPHRHVAREAMDRIGVDDALAALEDLVPQYPSALAV